MPELVNLSNNYQTSDILDQIIFPKNDKEIQQTLNETRRIQKNIAALGNTKDKRRKKSSYHEKVAKE